MRELEARLTEAEAFLSFKPKLQAKLQTLQSEVATYKRELADMKIEQQASEGRLQDLSEQLEMATLDKEVAEERAEAAEADLETEKELRAEKEVELSVFKQRLEGDPLAPGGDLAAGESSGAKNALDYIQLERQNERLKEALIR
jgi:dynactin 1